MAPWPEQGNEPKAPDKNSSDKCEHISLEEEVKPRVESTESSSCVPQSRTDQNHNRGESPEASIPPLPVVNLDEGALRTLLEEAITYKNPKDREKKSDLFKELLQEAEAEAECDEPAATATTSGGVSGGARSHFSGSRLGASRRKHGKRDVGISERQRSGGSLQNLVHAVRTGGGRPTRDHVSGSVSARQREGGSLPTNVNVQGVDNENDMIQSSELVCNYTSRATLQVSADDPHIHTDMAYPLSAKPIPGSFLNGIQQETPLQLNSSYNSVKSIMGSNTDPITKVSVNNATENPSVQYPAQHVSTCFLPISPQQIPSALDMNRISFSKEGSDVKAKSLDENGNALGSTNRLESFTNDRKGKRFKIKPKNYRNIVNAEQIEGHRWDEDIESLMKYIESPSSGSAMEQNKANSKSRQSNGPVTFVKGGRGGGVGKIRAKEDEGRKRRSKETSKLQKSNSLEEISKTKLEDLTSPVGPQEESTRARPKKQVTLDDAELGAARSWEVDGMYDSKATDRYSEEFPCYERDRKRKDKKDCLSDVADSEFHVVRKKQRKKKRQSVMYSRPNGGKVGNYANQSFPPHDRRDGQLLYRYRRGNRPPENPHPRRKSASSVPPSDKSDSSDLDSVHSLPVSSITLRPTVGKTSTSGGSTPQASYADITRSVSSPPRAAACTARRSTPVSTVPSSAASSGIGDEEAPPSPELVSTVTFVVPTKRDAMTDTNLDSMLPVEEYPPLEKKVSSELFVEFTVKRGRVNRETNISVEETVILRSSFQNKNDNPADEDSFTVLLKNPPPPSSASSSSSSSSTSSSAAVAASGPSTSKRPPVILMDESGKTAPQSANVSELTFGFEVNRTLLYGEDAPPPPSPPSPPPPPPPETATRPVPTLEEAKTSLDKMRLYLQAEWLKTLKELEDGEPSSSGVGFKVRYYSGE